ncbi:hypothetical protein [Streptomyces sp. LBL]|uniref:hypothetical protein n=1 Tax=Streptomyces sp. LBL TaxID=2940562 RepID=UPI002475FF5A|nr:hypothetical protein [Streptomyces sp. LBL]
MSENISPTELTSQYTAQVTTDLERNTKEQERIEAEIAGLQELLAALQRDQQVLVSIQSVIDAAPATQSQPQPAAATEHTGVPTPRTESATAPGTSTSTGTGTRGRAKKTGSASRRGPAKKQAATPLAGKGVTAKTKQPKLVDLVRSHLGEQSEPRSAAEIATALDQAHPDRNIKTTVIRTTLEGLVARTQAQRGKQGSSVFYTAPETPQQAAPAQTKKSAPADA